MQSALYEGVITHQRGGPTPHRFQYNTFMVYLNLNELPSLFSRSRLWSLERFNWASFRRKDFLRPDIADLRTAVQQEIHSQTGHHFSGDICLLTHIRYLGYCFNPVSFYYCFEQSQLRFIVAEINNTPWNERFCYVLCCDATRPTQHFRFRKQFHVSPFLPMDVEYDWTLNTPGEHLSIVMRDLQQGDEIFNAGLFLQRQDATTRNLRNMLLRFPVVTLKTVAGIYWQALRLWLKGASLHDHPPTHEVNPHGILHTQQSQPVK